MNHRSIGLRKNAVGDRLQFVDAVGFESRAVVDRSDDYLAGRRFRRLGNSAYVHSGTKRRFDIAMALGLIVVMFPLLLIIAALVKLTSKGPMIFKQRRNGVDGCFNIYKFRTMYHCDEPGAAKFVQQASRGDPRVTKVGYWLRKLSLDELPQVFNVLQGKMSIVGPRPHALSHDHHFVKLVPGYMKRYDCRPGITGLAQVSGARGETGTAADMQRRVRFDLEYIERASFLYDCKLLVTTAVRLLDTRDVY